MRTICNRYIGVIPLKIADHFGHHANAARRQDVANLYRADVTASSALSDKLGVLGLFEGGARLLEKALARLRQRYGTFFATRKELCAEHSLQGLNLVAERRRRDIELIGRTREVELLGHGHEIPEVSQFHCQMSVPKSVMSTHSRMY